MKIPKTDSQNILVGCAALTGLAIKMWGYRDIAKGIQQLRSTLPSPPPRTPSTDPFETKKEEEPIPPSPLFSLPDFPEKKRAISRIALGALKVGSGSGTLWYAARCLPH